MVHFTCTILPPHTLPPHGDKFKDEHKAQAEQMRAFSEGNVKTMEEKPVFSLRVAKPENMGLGLLSPILPTS